MSKECENCYKTSRISAGLTQEQAAELLHIGVRQLSDYENGHVQVPGDVLTAMVREYNCAKLPAQHIRAILPELAEYYPDPEDIENPYEAKVKLGWLAEWAREEHDRLDGILQDDTLSRDERQERFREGKKKFAAS